LSELEAIDVLVDAVETDLQCLGAECESLGRDVFKVDVAARDLNVECSRRLS
jgi:hypothetical protein